MTLSKNGIGFIILALEAALRMFGFEFADGTVAEVVNAVLVITGFALMAYHQYVERDTKFFLFK